MNAKQLAAELNGIEDSALIHFQGSKREEQAKAAGLVIAYGFSDDLLEFEGAISDEANAPGEVLVDVKGVLPTWDSASESEESAKEYFDRKAGAKTIKAAWNDSGLGPAWTLETSIPHETFTILEDGDPFGRGIVFALADLA